MSRYKKIVDRVPENPNVEGKALSVPDAPPAEREMRPFARFAAIAAATIVLFAGGVLSWQYMNGGDWFLPGSGEASADAQPMADTAIGDIRGLPAENYSITANYWTDHKNSGNFTGIYDLFCPFWSYLDGTPVQLGFVVAYVLDTQEITAQKQRAALQVLHCVNGELSGEISIEQLISAGCPDEERTNFLRKGGVYVLTIGDWRDSPYYSLYADDDVLFEVDDNGLIASHSWWRDFNKYDGKPLTELWGDIQYLIENPALASALAGDLKFDPAIYPNNENGGGFGNSTNPEIILRGTVTEKVSLADGRPQYYHISVTEYFHNPENKALDRVYHAKGYQDEVYEELEIGREYIFNGNSGSPFRYAMLDENGRILLPEYHNHAFKFAEGMTLDELREAIAFICDYYDIPYAPSQP